MLKRRRKPNVSYLHLFAFGVTGFGQAGSCLVPLLWQGRATQSLVRDRQLSSIVFLNWILLGIFTRFLVVCLAYSRVK
jgi:hypothetical protein